MKKLFYVLLLCISFVSCNEGYHKVVVIKKERVHHSIKSDRFYIIADFYFWEPAAGNGNLSNWLKQNGYNVVASDLKYRGCTDGSIIDGLDFLTTYPYNKFKGAAAHPFVILTNPPYSLATWFIEHALEILPEGGLYITLMNITYLHGIDRYKRVYSKGTLREVYVFSKKINVYKNNIPTGHTSMCVYAWYVFQKGYNGQPTLYWL